MDVVGAFVNAGVKVVIMVYCHTCPRAKSGTMTCMDNQRQDVVGAILKSEAVELFRKGCRLGFIAAKAGVSTERIRQVLMKAGYTSKTDFIVKLRADKKKSDGKK
jgi:hypothetical protein